MKLLVEFQDELILGDKDRKDNKKGEQEICRMTGSLTQSYFIFDAQQYKVGRKIYFGMDNEAPEEEKQPEKSSSSDSSSSSSSSSSSEESRPRNRKQKNNQTPPKKSLFSDPVRKSSKREPGSPARKSSKSKQSKNKIE